MSSEFLGVYCSKVKAILSSPGYSFIETSSFLQGNSSLSFWVDLWGKVKPLVKSSGLKFIRGKWINITLLHIA